LLTAAVGAVAAPLLPVIDVGRPGEEWIEEATNLDRRSEEMGPAVAVGNAERLLEDLGTVIRQTSREFERRPLRVAAAIAGAAAGRAARWAGGDPTPYLTMAMQQASAAGHAPAKAAVLVQQAAVLTEQAVFTGALDARVTETASAALWQAGATHAMAAMRSAARTQLAEEAAVAGDVTSALAELDASIVEGQKAHLAASVLHGRCGIILLWCGRYDAARQHLEHALGAEPIRRVLILTDLAMVDLTTGDADAAAGHLEEATHLALATHAHGRLAGIRAVRAQVAPGPHRDRLDDVLRG
jgi:tetratricopeptide (TPR) repeat protein